MALTSFVGSLAVQSATGNFAVTGVGFQPKAAWFWGTKLSADGSNVVGAGIPSWWGMAVSSTSRVAMTEGDDGVTSNAVATDATKCIKCITGASTVTFAADFVSFDADGFTVNFTTANITGYIINYLVWGGADITNVAIKSFTSGASTGNQATTGVGFQPDAMLAIGADAGGGSNAIAFGFGKSSSARGTSCTGDNSGENRVQKTTKVYTMLAGAAVRCEADLVTLDSDGFTWNWTTASATTHTIYALCFKGGSYQVGAFTQKTSTGTQAVTGTGFTPKGLLTTSVGLTAGAGITGNQCVVVAAVSDTTHRAAAQYGSPTFGMSALNRTDMYMIYDRPTAPAVLLAEAALSSFDSNGFTPNYTTADGTAREAIYFAFGDTAPITITPTVGTLGLTGATVTPVIASTSVTRTPTVGTLTLTGGTATVTATGSVTRLPTVGTLALSGNTVTVNVTGSGTTITPTVGSMTLTGGTVGVAFQGPDSGTLTLTGGTATVFSGALRTPTAGSLGLTGGTVTLSTPVVLVPTVGGLALAGGTVSVGAGQTSTPTAGSLAVTGGTITALLAWTAAVSSGAVTITGGTPLAQVLGPFQPPAAVLTLLGNRPRVINSGLLGGSGGGSTYRYLYRLTDQGSA